VLRPITVRPPMTATTGNPRKMTGSFFMPPVHSKSPANARRRDFDGLAHKAATRVRRDCHGYGSSSKRGISRRVHKWTRLEDSSGEGRCPPLVREVNSRTSPHLRPSLWPRPRRTVQFLDSSSVHLDREGRGDLDRGY